MPTALILNVFSDRLFCRMMQELPLSKSLVDSPEKCRLTLLIERRAVYCLVSGLTEGQTSVFGVIPADITAPSLAAAVQEAVYANPMLLLPFGRITVMINAREFFWLPGCDTDCADEAVSAAGYDKEDGRTILTAEADGVNSLVMLTEAPLLNFIRRTFPEAVITHPSAVMVRYLNRRGHAASGARVYVDLGADSLIVAVFDSAGLALCGSYRPTGVDSQTYYVIAAAKTAGVDPSEAEIFVSGAPDERVALIMRLGKFAHHVMPAIVPSAAFPELTDYNGIPYPLIISPLCE